MPFEQSVVVINTTIPEYVRGETNLLMRKRAILALCQDKGRVTYGHKGNYHEWTPRVRELDLTGYTDMAIASFARHDQHEKARLPWRNYISTDAYSYMDQLKNRGEEAIVREVMGKVKNMTSDAKRKFGDEMYVDGGTAGSARWHGIESFTANTGVSTKRPVAVPDDSYADMATDPGAHGGTWSNTGTTSHTMGDWPDGTGDTDFDCWMPLLVDYTSAIADDPAAGTKGWNAPTKTWPNTCLEALSFGIIAAQRNDTDGKIDLVTTNSEMYRQFLDKLRAEEQITVTRGQGGAMYKLGFENTQNFDGTDIHWEYGVPSSVAYGWNIEQMEIMCMEDDLIKVHDVFYDVNQLAFKLHLTIPGNFKFESPKFFVKWKNFT